MMGTVLRGRRKSTFLKSNKEVAQVFELSKIFFIFAMDIRNFGWGFKSGLRCRILFTLVSLKW